MLAGLVYDSNLGDRAIYESSLYIIQKMLEKKEKKIEIRALDLYGRIKMQTSYKNSLYRKILDKINYHMGRHYENPKFVCRVVMKEYDKIIDQGTCAIVFVGGGLIKFSHQVIAQPMCSILEKANEQNIPVMLSEVYFKQEEKKIFKWQKGCSEKIIGLGIGRTGLFEEYGKEKNEKSIINFWENVYYELTNRGYRCILFTNGLPADYACVLKLKKNLKLDNEQIAPRPKSVTELIQIINEFSAAIVTRLHSSIVAYSYNIPTIGIVWNNKQVMFGEEIGHPERFVEGNFDVKNIVDLLEELLEETDEINVKYCTVSYS